MNVQTLANAILIVLLIGWVGFRQLTWRRSSIAQMWRFPAIMCGRRRRAHRPDR